jgi:DNA-binding MarR family transcriptional regulator
MEQDFEKRLQAHRITRGAYAVLSAIHHDNKATPAELANFLGVDGAAVTRNLDRMEEHGLVRRTRSATDRRSIDISLTREGTRVVQHGRADSMATNKKFTQGLTEAEIEKLRSAIQTMLANANDAVPDI